MSESKKIYDPYLIKDTLGRTLFYPWGMFTYGYVIENDEFKMHLQNFFEIAVVIKVIVKIVWYVTLLIAIKTRSNYLISNTALAMCPVIIGLYIFWFKLSITKLTNGLTKTRARLSLNEYVTKYNETNNVWSIIYLAVSYSFFALVAWFLLDLNIWIFYGLMGYFGWLGLFNLYALKKHPFLNHIQNF